MSRCIAWLLLLVLFGAFGVSVWYVLQARIDAGKGLPAYSVFSEDRNGLAEAAQLLRQLGWEPVAVTRPIQQTRHRGLFIVAEPEDDDLDAAQARALLRWVEQGNVLLLLGRRSTAIHRELRVSLGSDVRAVQDETLHPAALGENGGYTDGIDRLVVEGHDTVWADEGLPLWWLGEQPGAVVLRRGTGRVLIVADPSLLTERGLLREDNVLFLYNLAWLHARAGRVYFDEYHHGLHSGGGFWGYLRYHDQQWLLGALVLAAFVAAWSVAVRLGPAVATPRPRRADGVDYASAVARIYQRAGVRRLLARGLVRDFLAALCHRLNLRRRALPAEILAAWRHEHPGAPSQHVEALLRGAVELHQEDGSERRLLAWTRAFDRFLSEQKPALQPKDRRTVRGQTP